ncbi:hypothetical protein BpHYR1_034512 [Brachionus plicatilis]|uniref:Uncharacterized protein n=1 Tax=Brachionus plicatilis TaxID=10195 RepID=A0A3M7RPH6_BRAPC|nr:hypothetical protein BpHYR1_034512 [Brachionus plicatilis]
MRNIFNQGSCLGICLCQYENYDSDFQNLFNLMLDKFFTIRQKCNPTSLLINGDRINCEIEPVRPRNTKANFSDN